MGNLEQLQSSLKYYEPDLSEYAKQTCQLEYTVWKNTNNKQEIEQYTKYFTAEERIQQEAEAFLLRLNQAHIVRSVFFTKNAIQEMCSKSFSVTVYLERIMLRLNDVTDVPYPDVLHLYHACFSGFATLFKIFGYFDVTEQMIGINGDYKVKVWCHNNLSAIRPCKSNPHIRRTERDMVHRIIDIIQSNTDSLSRLESFGKRTKYKNKSTFKQALRLLNEFAEQIQMDIPNSMQHTAKVITSKSHQNSKKSLCKKSNFLTKKPASSNQQQVSQTPINKIETRNEQPRQTAPFVHHYIHTQPAEPEPATINYTSRKPGGDQYAIMIDHQKHKAYKSTSPQIEQAQYSPKVMMFPKAEHVYFVRSHMRTGSSTQISPSEVKFVYSNKPQQHPTQIVPKLNLNHRKRNTEELPQSPKPYKEQRSTTGKLEVEKNCQLQSQKSEPDECFKRVKTHKHTRSEYVSPQPYDLHKHKFTNPQHQLKFFRNDQEPSKIRKVRQTKHSHAQTTKEVVTGKRSNLEFQ